VGAHPVRESFRDNAAGSRMPAHAGIQNVARSASA
jgi:hypothetical protein